MHMELHGYVGIKWVWTWAQVLPMDNLVDGQRVGRWVMGWIWTSSTRPKPDPLPSLAVREEAKWRQGSGSSSDKWWVEAGAVRKMRRRVEEGQK